jgi:hypothetical protein
VLLPAIVTVLNINYYCYLLQLLSNNNNNDNFLLTTDTPADLCPPPVAYPGILFEGKGGVKQIQLRTDSRENGNLGAVTR